jgi:hypothetical protein
MSPFIQNGANTPLNEQNTGGVPDVGGALLQWFRPMVFGIVTKHQGRSTGYRVLETKVSVNFKGVWQPFTDRQLLIKPEGERAWKWFMVHADPTLILENDSIITYQGVQYRVDSQRDYSLYGYVQYSLVDDYTGSGPTEETP